jgi:hypothetical protein
MRLPVAILGLAILPAYGRIEETKERARTSETAVFSLTPGGVIRVDDSFGELHIEGWHKPQVEVTIEKATRKDYPPDELAEAMRELDEVRIEIAAAGSSVEITTEMPRRLLQRPLRGKTNIELVYRIKAPHRVNLEIQHDLGKVTVEDVVGHHRISSRAGEVSLRLPDDQSYSIDARTRVGEVESEFGGEAKREMMVGQRLTAEGDDHAWNLYLRLGAGEIEIRKLPFWHAVETDRTMVD